MNARATAVVVVFSATFAPHLPRIRLTTRAQWAHVYGVANAVHTLLRIYCIRPYQGASTAVLLNLLNVIENMPSNRRKKRFNITTIWLVYWCSWWEIERPLQFQWNCICSRMNARINEMLRLHDYVLISSVLPLVHASCKFVSSLLACPLSWRWC